MSTRDAFEFINEQDEAVVQSLANRLEFRGRDPTFSGFREADLRRLALPASAVVLDLGCGTGVVARALAARDDFAGSVTAVDQSPELVATARRLAAEAGVADRIDFRVGDVHALDLPHASFDAVLAHTLVSHVRDPLQVLRAAAEVTRPGGTIAIFDGDYASWTFGCSDVELGQAMERAILAAVISKPRVMRDMPRLLRTAGLELLEVLPFIYADVGEGRFFPGAAEAYAPLVARAGLLPAEQVERWLAEQRQAMEQEIFFSACNYYAYLARR